MMEKMAYQAVEKEYDERVVDIARVAKVVKGGRKFHFRVTIVAGDNNGNIGLGVGKAGAVPEAMAKATLQAHKNMRKVSLSGTTIPHEVVAKFVEPKCC
jgi:small subunit ribosomal protein S5